MPRNFPSTLQAYIEEIALFFEHGGLPRIGGRVLGLLLVCEPEFRSASQIVEELGASKASVSMMIRLLVSGGLLEKTAIPGDRSTYYRISSDGFEAQFEQKLANLLGFCPIAERGIELLEEHGNPKRTQRLREMLALYGFLERELRPIFEKWRNEREQLIAATKPKKRKRSR